MNKFFLMSSLKLPWHSLRWCLPIPSSPIAAWEKSPTPTWLQPPFWRLQRAIRSPLILPFSRENTPSCLSRSSGQLLEEPPLAAHWSCTDPQMPHHLLCFCTTHQATDKHRLQKSKNQAKNSAQKFFPRNNLLLRALSWIFWILKLPEKCTNC